LLFSKLFVLDLEFAKQTEEVLKRIISGEKIRREFDDFIEDMKKW
jgi:hypothetical protein